MFHTKAWVLWLAAALLPFLLTKNPLYLLLAILVLGVDFFVLCPTTTAGQQWSLLLWLALTLGLFGIVFNVLFVSIGATRLATLPTLQITLSESVIQIGGAVTLESLVYGLMQALGLIGILIAFATFNARCDHYQLLRGAPRFFYQSAIVLSIAVTFVPQMMVAQAEIREAQMLRGHRFRTIRDLPPLFIALLAQGLEHSITLAESMSARGFGGKPERAPPVLRTLIALGLFMFLCGALAFSYFPDKLFGITLFAVGGGMLATALWRIGERVQSSRYRRERWEDRDTILIGASLSSVAVFLSVWLIDRSLLIFYPYPQLTLPLFQPLVAIAILFLASPVILFKMTTR